MPSDQVVDHFIKGLDAPEFIFAIGILIILSYVVVKALPILEALKTKKIEAEHEIEMKKIENDQRRDERKSDEFQKELEANRTRAEMISKQNEILEGLTRAANGQTVQMAGLIASIEESKTYNRNMGATIQDTNSKVSEMHTIFVKSRH